MKTVSERFKAVGFTKEQLSEILYYIDTEYPEQLESHHDDLIAFGEAMDKAAKRFNLTIQQVVAIAYDAGEHVTLDRIANEDNVDELLNNFKDKAKFE